MNINSSDNTFLLDDNSNFEIFGTPKKSNITRWQYPEHCKDKRYSLILISGESLKTINPLRIGQDTCLFIRYTALHTKNNRNDRICEIQFLSNQHQTPINIAKLTMTGKSTNENWCAVTFDLSWLSGHIGNLIIKYPEHTLNDTSDCISIADLCLAREDRLSLIKAKTFNTLRTKNEIEHFSNAYKHDVYTAVQNKQALAAGGNSRPIRKLVANHNIIPPQAFTTCHKKITPKENESSHAYASRILALSINQNSPDFVARLTEKANSKNKIKILSLCSGAARIEAGFSAAVPSNVEWSLLDINAELLNIAASQFPNTTKLDLIEANANELTYTGEKWDIILCVSALHHLVELEKVIKFIHHSLFDDGEFWSIGEYVGRNGNRLWPEARHSADIFFSTLPKKYRLNAHTKKVDHVIPDNDYSVGCFEGIRSEDIEPLLDNWFQPVDVYRRNCFLWRMINLAYSDNYDLSCHDDLNWIKKMVEHEIEHFRTEGHGTELFGVYKPRKF